MLCRLGARPLVRGSALSVVSRRIHTEKRIAELGYTLPELPQPVGAYTLGVNQGGWVYLVSCADPCTRDDPFGC